MPPVERKHAAAPPQATCTRSTTTFDVSLKSTAAVAPEASFQLIAEFSAEAAVDRGLFAPGVELFGQLRVIGRMCERLLIHIDGAIDLASLIQHVSQQK